MRLRISLCFEACFLPLSRQNTKGGKTSESKPNAYSLIDFVGSFLGLCFFKECWIQHTKVESWISVEGHENADPRHEECIHDSEGE